MNMQWYLYSLHASGHNVPRNENFSFVCLRRWLGCCWLIVLLVLAGCSSTPEPTATPIPTRTPLPTFTPTIDVPTAIPVEEIGTPAADAVSAANTPEATVTLPSTVEATACAVESNLDLAGYPNLEETMGCALEAASRDPVAINEFGTGPDYDRFMLWFSTTQEIYVLLPDGTWQAYPDTWQEGEPEILCNPLEGPDASPPLPRRGFGKLWCSVPEVQSAMGGIEREERLCQHVVSQEFERGRLVACFEDATIRYFRILSNNQWDVVMVQ